MVNKNESDLLEKRVDEIASQITANSKHIISLGKKAFYQQIDLGCLKKAYDLGKSSFF